MSEIVFEYSGGELNVEYAGSIRWLSEDDYEIFADHLHLCGQRAISTSVWQEIINEGTVYCILYADQKPVARACVEKYSQACWEVADVRVSREYRNRGYARAVCSAVLQIILESGKIATIRTEEDNAGMLKVIEQLGFVRRCV